MKKFLCALAAVTVAATTCLSTVSFASVTMDGTLDWLGSAVDDDGSAVDGTYSPTSPGGKYDGDGVPLGETLYIPINNDPALNGPVGGVYSGITISELFDSDLFTFKIDKDDGSKYVDRVTAGQYKVNGTRAPYFKVTLKDSTTTDEVKISFDVYFKARKADTTGRWNSGDVFGASIKFWAQNPEEDGDDATIETGSGTIFRPVSNELNTVTWGDPEVASLEFNADSDAKKFYARLSTKNNNTVYQEYGDPANADLYFRTFSDVSISSTSRGTLVLYNPWDEDEVDPLNIYIYAVNSDGTIEDITSLFKYVDEDETPAGLEGWETRTRTLGTYVISDTELDIGYYDDEEDPPMEEDPEPLPPAQPKPPTQYIPDTGSENLTGVAMLLSALSLGTLVAIRKRKK